METSPVKNRYYPGAAFVIAALALVLLACLSYFFVGLLKFWLVFAALCVFAVLIDLIALIFWTETRTVSRKIENTLSLGLSTSVELALSREKTPDFSKKQSIKQGVKSVFRPVFSPKIKIFDIYDDLFHCETLPVAVQCPKNQDFTVKYDILPVKRGKWTFPGAELLFPSPLHFWRKLAFHKVESSGTIYPSFRELSSGALLSFFNYRGEKPVRRRGTGLEFESLREWQPGDSIRAVDWRATSRKARVIVRNWTEERNQDLLILLDSGFRLNRQEEEARAGAGFRKTQFDSALNAALYLSRLALKAGDSVSFYVFGNSERYIPPVRGQKNISFISKSLFDVQCSASSASIFSALEKAMNNLKKRTFIIVISNFREEDEDELSLILKKLVKRHLLLMVSLREEESEALARMKIDDKTGTEDALISTAAFCYLENRKKLYKKWEHLGLLTLDAPSSSISSALINSYLKVKKMGVL